jgi:hypothetical protein
LGLTSSAFLIVQGRQEKVKGIEEPSIGRRDLSFRHDTRSGPYASCSELLCKTTALNILIFRREVLKKVHNTVFCQDQSAVLGPILPVGEEQASSVCHLILRLNYNLRSAGSEL